MELKERIVALDIGTKRIGVAVSDVFWLGASPVKTILRNNDSKIFATSSILKLV